MKCIFYTWYHSIFKWYLTMFYDFPERYCTANKKKWYQLLNLTMQLLLAKKSIVLPIKVSSSADRLGNTLVIISIAVCFLSTTTSFFKPFSILERVFEFNQFHFLVHAIIIYVRLYFYLTYCDPIYHNIGFRVCTTWKNDIELKRCCWCAYNKCIYCRIW